MHGSRCQLHHPHYDQTSLGMESVLPRSHVCPCCDMPQMIVLPDRRSKRHWSLSDARVSHLFSTSSSLLHPCASTEMAQLRKEIPSHCGKQDLQIDRAHSETNATHWDKGDSVAILGRLSPEIIQDHTKCQQVIIRVDTKEHPCY